MSSIRLEKYLYAEKGAAVVQDRKAVRAVEEPAGYGAVAACGEATFGRGGARSGRDQARPVG